MNAFRKLLWLLMVLPILLISSCGDDDEGLDPTSQDLIGVWQSTEASLGFTIDGVSLYQYYLNQGLTEEEAGEALNLVGNLFIISLSGTIEFKEDKTYTANFGGDVETGTWEVRDEGDTLVMTVNGTSDVTEAEIISIGASRLILGYSDSFMDDDTGEQIEVEIELTLDKAN